MGVKLDLFNKYREALGLMQDAEFTADSLIETIKPFLLFTRNSINTQNRPNVFRNLLYSSELYWHLQKDPEKTFFEDLACIRI